MRLFPQFALHEFKEEQPLWTYYLSFDKGKNESKLFSLRVVPILKGTQLKRIIT